LRGEAVPNTITSQYEELLLPINLMGDDIWIGSDDLVFCVEGEVLFEFEVTDSSG
jgi:hypothetical protein